MTNGRTCGDLAVSRSFGDKACHPFVTSLPEITSFTLEKHSDQFIVLCCDGVWDVLTDQEVVNIIKYLLFFKPNQRNMFETLTHTLEIAHYFLLIRESSDKASAAYAVRDVAYSLGSQDNISVLIADFKWETEDTADK